MFTDLGTYMENGVQVHVWSVHFYNNSGALSVSHRGQRVAGKLVR